MLSRRSFVKTVAAGTAGVLGLSHDTEALVTTQRVGDRPGRDLTQLSVGEASELVRRKKVSPVELASACLQRIERLNPTINAFITVTAESAMQEAREAERQIQHGQWRGPLHGIPIGLKDLIDTANVKTTCASAVFANRIPAEDAEVVTRLRRAGAVLLGKHNMHEFAYGGTSVPSHYGPVRNPWNTSRIAGGSSGGSAAAVSAGLCFAAIGSDTGGSIREPSAFCGIAGLKPTYGRVSTRGVVPLSWSLDHVGPMCRTVTDLALVLEAIAGYDPREPTSVEWPVDRYSRVLRNRNTFRIGVVPRPYFEDLDSDVDAIVKGAMSVLKTVASDVREVALPAPSPGILGPEAYAFHAPYFTKSPDLYQPETRDRLRQAAAIPTVAYVEGRRQLDHLRRTVGSVFTDIDLLVTPTCPVQPLTVEEVSRMEAPPPGGEVWMRNTRPFNAFGLPAVSIPCGVTDAGLPVGLQIAGPRFAESRVLAFAHAFEQATQDSRRFPPL